MKNRLREFTFILCNAFAATAVFGQFNNTITWTNFSATTPGGGNFGRTTNWFGGAPTNGVLCVFDGTVPGNLLVFTQDGIDGQGGATNIGGGFGSSGITLKLASTQTGSLNFICSTAVTNPIGMGFNGIQVDAGAGRLTLGDDSVRRVIAVLRPAGGTHIWENNSTNPVVINSNVQFRNGGGTFGHRLAFQGTGDWLITNYLRFAAADPPLDLQWDSTGTTVWVAKSNDFITILNSITINAGTVIVESSGLLQSSFGTNTFGTNIVNNGTLIVYGTNSGRPTIVYGGKLSGTGILGAVTIESGGTLAPGTSVGALTVDSNLTLNGNVFIEVNKSLSPSNDFVIVNGTLANAGAGTLTVTNLGPALQTGDKFTLFNKPVQSGAAMPVSGAGVKWANQLATDGSIRVIGPILDFTQAGNDLQFYWVGNYKLQSQTNSLEVGLSTNWDDYPGGGTSGVIVPIDGTKDTVFFRLISP